MARSIPARAREALAAALLLAGVARADVYESAEFGFRLTLPDGWVTTEERETGDGLEVAWAPVAAADRVQLKLRVNPQGVGRDPGEAVERILASVVGDEAYANPRRERRSWGGEPVPALAIDSLGADGTWRVRQAFLARHGLLYQLQDVTVPDDFDARVDGFDAIWETLQFTELSPERRRRQRLESLAARCGSEVDWATSWADAVRRAELDERPILASVRRYPGFDLSDERLSGFFMDRDVLALLSERFVPLLVTETMDVPMRDPEVYGMSAFTFGEGLLLVDTAGRVLFDSFVHADAVLLEALAADPPWAGEDPHDLPDAALERAERRYRRGELEACFDDLARLDDDEPRRTFAAERLRARVAARRSDAEAAWAALTRARALLPRLAPDARADIELELSLEEAPVLAGLGREREALERLDAVLAARTDDELEARALSLRGELTWATEGADAARPWFERLALDEDRADDRWAWAAAARLTSTRWALDKPGAVAWPDPSALRLFAPPRFAPLPLARASEAARDALEHLLDEQLEVGHWPSMSDVSRAADEPADDFQLAITALAIQALLPHADEPAVDAAITRASQWLLPAYEAAAAAPREDAFMDYSVWSRPYVLWVLADLVDAGRVQSERARELAAHLHDAMEALQKPAGGWSYYLTGDVESAPPTVLVSMTFTTAVNVLALLRSREAGLAPPEALIERGLDSLESALTPGGLFVYMAGAEAQRPTGPSGAAGRGPLCAWALRAGGRGEPDAIEDALDHFMRHREAYARETGKALMHTGPQAEGSHWLLFDYANAAAAAAQLPGRLRRRYERPLLELLLAARTESGAFVDNPLLGEAYGAAMALITLGHLQVD